MCGLHPARSNQAKTTLLWLAFRLVYLIDYRLYLHGVHTGDIDFRIKRTKCIKKKSSYTQYEYCCNVALLRRSYLIMRTASPFLFLLSISPKLASTARAFSIFNDLEWQRLLQSKSLEWGCVRREIPRTCKCSFASGVAD